MFTDAAESYQVVVGRDIILVFLTVGFTGRVSTICKPQGLDARVRVLKDLTIACSKELMDTEHKEKYILTVLGSIQSNLEVSESLLVSEGRYVRDIKTDHRMLSTIVKCLITDIKE